VNLIYFQFVAYTVLRSRCYCELRIEYLCRSILRCNTVWVIMTRAFLLLQLVKENVNSFTTGWYILILSTTATMMLLTYHWRVELYVVISKSMKSQQLTRILLYLFIHTYNIHIYTLLLNVNPYECTVMTTFIIQFKTKCSVLRRIE